MDRPRHRLHFRLNSMEVTSFGTHQIIVEYNQGREWLQASRLPILIRKVEESS
jgi:bifunctional pyridoxal-dependent enzyme with beta-cystathionase and maltose regulon repressor activities